MGDETEKKETRKKINKAEIKKQIVEAVKKGNTEKVHSLRKILLNG